jgi:hypothetical protein
MEFFIWGGTILKYVYNYTYTTISSSLTYWALWCQILGLGFPGFFSSEMKLTLRYVTLRYVTSALAWALGWICKTRGRQTESEGTRARATADRRDSRTGTVHASVGPGPVGWPHRPSHLVCVSLGAQPPRATNPAPVPPSLAFTSRRTNIHMDRCRVRLCRYRRTVRGIWKEFLGAPIPLTYVLFIEVVYLFLSKFN